MSAPGLQRARYGWAVLQKASGVLLSRLRPPVRLTARPRAAFNTMFDTSALPSLEPERATLERFDLYLFEMMNAPRLRGQIVFEYGTLLRACARWDGRRVLDVGTGRSSFPRWMSAAGASVTTFDLATPAEALAGGFQTRVDALVAWPAGAVHAVIGSMRTLPFAAASFDLVTSLSVVEHLDTDLPARTFVPYAEQERRLAQVLDEMIRVTRPGGHLYLTSECCDYDRASTDTWRGAYYYDDGPALSAAWPAGDVSRLFYEYVSARGCDLVGGVQFRAEDISDPRYWTSRGPYFSGFSLLARKR